MAQAAGEVFLEATSCAYLGWVARERGNPAAGRAPLEKSRALLTQLDDPWERSEVLLPLAARSSRTSPAGKERSRFGRVPRAQARDRRRDRDLGLPQQLGWDALLSGDFDRASAYLEEAPRIARELGDTFRLTLAICNLGLSRRPAGPVPGSRRRSFGRACSSAIRRGDRRCGAEAALGLAAAVAGLGDDELSVKLDAIHRALMADAGIVYDAADARTARAPLSLSPALGSGPSASRHSRPRLARRLSSLRSSWSTRARARASRRLESRCSGVMPPTRIELAHAVRKLRPRYGKCLLLADFGPKD